jgi:hypothetical protein
MKKLAKTLLSQGHSKVGYLFEMTEIEVIALRKHFDGKKLKNGCPLYLGLESIKKSLPLPKVPQERMAELLNPRFNHYPYTK